MSPALLVGMAQWYLEWLRWLESPQLMFVKGRQYGRVGRRPNVYELRAADVAVRVIERTLRCGVE